MPTIRLGSRDLLEYDARYGVLICRECQYAIQKSALQSHLLRHKIYRGEREQLLSSIAQLNIYEPHNVPLPSPASTPIDALPVISGYRCTAPGCGNLCASSKRMKRHWSEIHGFNKPPPGSSSFARPAKLQTFFRGTRLRYFEVAASPAVGTAGAALLITTDDHDNDERHDEQGHNEDDADLATPIQPSPMLTPPDIPPDSSPVNLDLQMLTYFHHFITTTSLTLPGAQHPQPYWQTDVVLLALRRRWLMYGLLAISACHLAVLEEDTAIKRVHRERLVQFFSEFTAGWDETVKRDLGVANPGVEDEVQKAGGQMRCMLHCAHWALAGSTFDQAIISELVAPLQLQSIMTTIRGFVVPNITLRPDDVWIDDDARQQETFAQARQVLEMTTSSDAESFNSISGRDNTSSALLSYLRVLPYRMAETFGKPDSAQDVLATLSAIAAMVKCCDNSFTSDEVGTAWVGMVTWLTKAPDHFNHMISRHKPAALVVLAYWAAFLVKRAENYGCWFLRGLTNTILLQIAEKLPSDDSAVQSLVGNLML